MTVTDIFSLYLAPWAAMLGLLVAFGLLNWFVEALFEVKARRLLNLAAALIAAPLAYYFLDVGFSRGLADEPLFLQISHGSYIGCGLLLAAGALIELAALFSEQVDIAKRNLVARDSVEP